jgi:hypothetical protein
LIHQIKKTNEIICVLNTGFFKPIIPRFHYSKCEQSASGIGEIERKTVGDQTKAAEGFRTKASRVKTFLTPDFASDFSTIPKHDECRSTRA